MHVTYWINPMTEPNGSDRWVRRHQIDFWRFQIDDQGDRCFGGVVECVWIVPGTLECE